MLYYNVISILPRMTQTSIDTRQGLPFEMQILLRDYPRVTWPENPNLARSTQNWMAAHSMFRQLAEIITQDTQGFLDKSSDPQHYARRLAHFGNLLVRNLHGHHHWEDRDFFPELEAADPRFATGLAMLEGDHAALDALLDRFTRTANRVVQLATLEETQMADEAGPLADISAGIERFLHRHLSDEEDLAVPILLHHRLRG